MTEPHTLAASWDVAVIGGGPAGLAAATATSHAGLSTVLFDENPDLGGQIFRAVTTTPIRRPDILGEDYWQGAKLLDETRRSGAVIVNNAAVWNLDFTRELAVSVGGSARLLSARRVIIATGAQERPFPIAGWTLPGVVSVGGAQTLFKTSGVIPVGRTVLAGAGPLLWLFAAQLLRAGGKIDAILSTQGIANLLDAARHAPGFLLSPYFRKGVGLLGEVRRKVRVVPVDRLQAHGKDKVESVTFGRGRREQSLPVDNLLIHQGVVPNVDLGMAAGLDHVWDEGQLCWRPVLDTDFGSSIAGIAVAGDGAGIAGGMAAIERGHIAGMAAVRALRETINCGTSLSESRSRLRYQERGRRFLNALDKPAAQLRRPEGDVMVCRCEEVKAGAIRELAAKWSASASRIKSLTRCGMGPCQGRMCALSVSEVVADQRGVPVPEVGYLRRSVPVKPVRVGTLATMEIASERALT